MREKLPPLLKKTTGLMMYVLAEGLIKANFDSHVPQKLLYKSQFLGYRPRKVVLRQLSILGKQANFIKKDVIEQYLHNHTDIGMAKRLAKLNFELGIYTSALEVISSIPEDIDALEIKAMVLSKLNRTGEYIDTLKEILKSQKTTHRYNQILFAYGRLQKPTSKTRF